MRLMLIVADSAIRDEIEILLRKAGAHGYTEFAPSAGWGSSGPRLGSGAFPETSVALLTALDDAAERNVRVALAGYEAGEGRQVHAYAWPVEEVA